MTAQTFTAVVRPSTVWSTEKKKGGNYALTSTAVTALAAVTTATTINEVLDVLSTVVRDSHVVDANQIGGATSTLN
jgi:hypothetical protein